MFWQCVFVSQLQFPLEYGAVLILVKFVSLEAALLTRVWWRCTVMDSGELCVMTCLLRKMLTRFADSWDILVQNLTTISQSELHVM